MAEEERHKGILQRDQGSSRVPQMIQNFLEESQKDPIG
jgi:hypothetical protein